MKYRFIFERINAANIQKNGIRTAQHLLFFLPALKKAVNNQAHQYINEHIDQNLEYVALWN
jgi:hypothetical protein